MDQRFLTGRLCKPGSLWTGIEVLDETESTNAVVAERARDGAAEGLVVCAEYQTAGRGRLGRTWSAPPRSAVLFSILLRPATVPPARWPWLGLLTPLAVADAVRAVGEIDARVKWPNDVLVEDRKLAGILLERVEAGDGMAAGGDPAAVLPSYRGLSATLGREVRAELPDGTTLTGTAADVDTDGRLVIDGPGRRTALAAGDIVHLRPA